MAQAARLYVHSHSTNRQEDPNSYDHSVEYDHSLALETIASC